MRWKRRRRTLINDRCHLHYKRRSGRINRDVSFLNSDAFFLSAPNRETMRQTRRDERGTMHACKLILRANRSGDGGNGTASYANCTVSLCSRRRGGGGGGRGQQNCTRALTQPRVKMTVRADKTPRLSDGVRTRGGVVELSKTLDLLQILAFMMTRSFRARLDSIWFGLGPMSSLFN